MSSFTLATASGVFPSSLNRSYSDAYRPRPVPMAAPPRPTIVDGSNAGVNSTQAAHYHDSQISNPNYIAVGGQFLEDPQCFALAQDLNQHAYHARDIQTEQMAKLIESFRSSQAAAEAQILGHVAERQRLAAHFTNIQKQLVYERIRFGRLLECYKKAIAIAQQMNESQGIVTQDYPIIKQEPDQGKQENSCEDL
ncbi:hypothetical protein TWF481_002695 [Arthrobotrys musiformis]|uniref:Biogenesis of lysosome-related organelles complex 1 subunit KXD1 n=1 Tax=Arthrobotrys musiformis TaxID=47236 RepID=A0AAV9VS57_9PEZI